MTSRYRFDDVEVDLQGFRILKAGRPVAVEPKALHLLIFLVENRGRLVGRRELIDAVWNGAFVTDHVLSRAIGQLRRLLADDPKAPRYVETVPTLGYRFIADVETETVASEIAPSKGEDVSNLPPPPGVVAPDGGATRPGRRRGIAAGIALALILGIVAFWVVRQRPRSLDARSIQSLAVLPLDNLSGDAGQDYFADGMTDELTAMLAKNSTLRVISRTSAMQYKGAHRPLPELARELGVDGILEGSIARTGNQVHVALQLIQAPTDTHLWAESYDRDANDAVSLPREAAQTIARRLGSVAPQSVASRYVSPEAHDAYLRGRYIWVSGSNEEAGKYFRKATELQPDYALGWAGLSLYYSVAGAAEIDMSPEKAFGQAEAAANKALALDDSLPEAHLALGTVLFLGRWNWARAEQEVSRAIELNSGFAEAYYFRSIMLTALNRDEEAIEAAKKSMELDPFARLFALAATYVDSRQYDAALNEAHVRLETYPQDASLHDILAQTYRRTGALKEAAQEWEKANLLSGQKESAAGIRHDFETGGYRAMLLWQVRYLKQKSAKQYVSPVELALRYAQLGQREETLSLLEEGYRQRSPQLLGIQCDPAYDFLHTDERYRAIIRKVGLPPAY